ncbi:MFS transporter [Paratractidigestivibacter sp.]|uniref:MFS transporter n=1 Tax=Paratractidigestivibacter sp. TaxID=2847316 RepID=UPI002ABE9B16|nr:MFS transporter [Paratractidigestivibacter sp.]
MASLLLVVIYIAFVSLGLPDSLLGSAWPVMYVELGAPVAAQSAITMIITACTVVSSLATAPLVRRLGTGKLVAGSVALTALAILGFSASASLWQLLLLAVPYGLGAGSIDSALNNYVAIHYGERHMSWLHCCWGIGTSVSPVIMGRALAGPMSWHGGYLAVGLMQAVITGVMVFSLPLWKRAGEGAVAEDEAAAAGEGTAGAAAGRFTYADAFRLPGAKSAIFSFGCYSAFEYVCGLWSSSHLVLARGITEAQAATMASFFYMGITVGRLISGFIAPHVGSKNMIRLGQGIAVAGIAPLIAGQGEVMLSVALALIGLGCAPIYPSIIALTPERFGENASQSMVSLQMACAYVGSTFAPPLCAALVAAGGAAFVPWLLVVVLVAMVLLSERANARLSAK